MEGAKQIAAGTHLGDWPRRVWVISDGTAGMLSQCLALLRAMGLDGEDIPRGADAFVAGLSDIGADSGLAAHAGAGPGLAEDEPMAGFMYHLRAAHGRHFNRREAAQWRPDQNHPYSGPESGCPLF